MKQIVNNLTISLKKRFRGIFVGVAMDSQDLPCDNLPFSENIYFLASIVDPRFNLRWISVDVGATPENRDTVRAEMTGRHDWY